MASVLSIHSSREGDRHTLTLTGELDMASTPVLEAKANQLVSQGARELVLDLGQLEFIDSSASRGGSPSPCCSAIGAGRHRRPEGRLRQMLAVREQTKLSRRRRAREPAAAQREKPRRPCHIDPGGSQVARPADHRAAPPVDERARGGRADPWHTDQALVRRAGDLDRKALGMRERPRRLWIVVERQVAVAGEDQLVVAEAVLPDEVLGLVEP